MDVNTKLQKLLNAKGWTPYRLAKNSGLSESTIRNVFVRNNVPSISTLETICHAFGITLAQFFTEGDVVELTPELKQIFEMWTYLSIEQKNAIVVTMQSMLKNQ
ncbi:MAG: helix-turn-helix transcriptional regulator [Clostridia bacterium]|nr:helix-turn-helix transcriptional regulator [Clostridia bacterium]